jgi:hypothetical protein
MTVSALFILMGKISWQQWKLQMFFAVKYFKRKERGK